MKYPHSLRISLGSIDFEENGDLIYQYLADRLNGTLHQDRVHDLIWLHIVVEDLAAGEVLAQELVKEFDNFFSGGYSELLKKDNVVVDPEV